MAPEEVLDDEHLCIVNRNGSAVGFTLLSAVKPKAYCLPLEAAEKFAGAQRKRNNSSLEH